MPQLPALRKLSAIVRQQGLPWTAFRALHAARIRTGWFRWRLPPAAWAETPSCQFQDPLPVLAPPSVWKSLGSDQAAENAERIVAGEQVWYSNHAAAVGFPPNWSRTPFGEFSLASVHWSAIDDFASGDIKNVWELGRFGFVFPLLRGWVRTSDGRFAEAIWQAIESWRQCHPPQRGPHWKCGQEVALRTIAWSFAFLHLAGHESATPTRRSQLAEMIDISARRIEANLGYALSQQNNHGVSEAAGLMTAGLMLGNEGRAKRGRRLLERLAETLIYTDGSFSQHSTNYHRLMLHLYLWAIQLGRAAHCELGESTVARIRQAGRWLRAMLTHEGGVPNLGHNDGAHLFDLTDLGYLDFRPTVQAIGLVTSGQAWLPPGAWDELAAWLGASSSAPPRGGAVPAAGQLPVSSVEDTQGCDWPLLTEFAEGGYCVWRSDAGLDKATHVLGLLRCPRCFQHRPSQCDLLHFDLWVGGRNLLRDAGSFSYNCDEPWQSYFGSSAAHNTVQFDNRDCMPKISRFLYGAWPRLAVQRTASSVTASYRDYRGAMHSRMVEWTGSGFRIVDELAGQFGAATLRWRLDPETEWEFAAESCRGAGIELRVEVEPAGGDRESKLAEGWESRFYQQKTRLPVWETTVSAACRKLVTEVRIVDVDRRRIPAASVQEGVS